MTGRGETILLVEDDQMLRMLIATSLENSGYRVIEAANGLDAIRKWEQHDGQIDLIFTDMVMSGGMTGLDVIERLRSLQPKLRSIISSGYSLELTQDVEHSEQSIRFLSKPYQPSLLTQMVRDCLDAS
jgi:CheY-like chemotaxis protein